MKFFFGLGNPGQKYAQTRHNAGFIFLDYWAKQLMSSSVWKQQKKLKANILKLNHKILVKPKVYMNNSGEVVRAVVDYYADSAAEQNLELRKKIFLVHDDLDLEIGQYKIQFGVGPKGHNGLLSTYQHLGTDQFWHIRIGVDDRQGDRSVPPQNYVLQQLPTEQHSTLVHAFGQIIKHLPQLNV